MRDNVDLSQPDSVPASVRGIVVSLYLAFQCACAISPFLSVPWLVDARIPHAVISHLLRALDLVSAT